MHHAGAKTQHLWSAAAADTATCTNPLINSHTCNAWLLVECGVSRDAVGRARVEAWEHPVCSNRWMLMKGWSKTCATASVSPALASPAGQDLWKGGVAFVDHRPARRGFLPHRNTALKNTTGCCAQAGNGQLSSGSLLLSKWNLHLPHVTQLSHHPRTTHTTAKHNPLDKCVQRKRSPSYTQHYSIPCSALQ